MGFKDRIEFSTYIMKYQLCKMEEHRLYYKSKKLKKQGSFDIIHDISENYTLVQLM